MVQFQNLRENAKFATSIATGAVLAPPESIKIVSGWGSAPDPAESSRRSPKTLVG